MLRIDELADDAVLDELGIDDPFELTGLYGGRPVGEKSSLDTAAMPDRIHLYRRALLDEWIETGVALEALVAHIVIHEIGHHFGLSDGAMLALEQAAGWTRRWRSTASRVSAATGCCSRRGTSRWDRARPRSSSGRTAPASRACCGSPPGSCRRSQAR